MFRLAITAIFLLVCVSFSLTTGSARENEERLHDFNTGRKELADSIGKSNKYKGFERAESLITAEELKRYIDTKSVDLVIIAVAGIIDYRLGHIPGSIRVWRCDYAAAIDESCPSGGMMADMYAFEEFARGLGVNGDSTVVIYDHELDATRLWWGFYLYGKKDIRVLDGGFQAWVKAGYCTDILAPSKPKPGKFKAASPLSGWSANMSDVWACKSDRECQLWDVREKGEWAGNKLMWGAHRKGRIPWAKFLNWKEFKRKSVGSEKPAEFKNAAEVQEVIEKSGIDKEKHHVFYCQIGVRSTVNMFVLYLMGWDTPRLHNYDGSWAEWSYYDNNPVIIGN